MAFGARSLAAVCGLAAAAWAGNPSLRGRGLLNEPAEQPGTDYYWPRYDYTNADVNYKSERTLNDSYVCKWDATVMGLNTNMGILYLPPCTWITPHWHPTTYELNFVLQGQVDYTIFPFGTGPGGINDKEPLKGSVPAGNLVMSPLGVMHLLVNNQCGGLAMMHSFPTSTTEDFFSMWAQTQTMPKEYLQDAFPAEPADTWEQIANLRIPDGIHTLSQQCMARCNITEDFYKSFQCPEKLPLKDLILNMPEPGSKVHIDTSNVSNGTAAGSP